MEVLGPDQQEQLAAHFAAQRARQAGLRATLERIDLEALQAAAERRYEDLFRAPYLAVLDTEFFRSAFQSQLKFGGPPLSLRLTREGHLRLFIAEETLFELFDKLAEFADGLGATADELERLLVEEWGPSVYVVELPTESNDSRVALVAARDQTDRPAAILATTLSPCILLTKDKDFEALEVVRPGDPVFAVRMTIVVNSTTMELQTMVQAPMMPIIGVTASVEWIGKKIGGNPWLLGGILAAILGLIYWRMDEEKRATTREALGYLGRTYVEHLVVAQENHQAAVAALKERIVPALQQRTSAEVILRHLACSEEDLSAQRLWEQLDPGTRPSVAAVRQLLRTHPAVVRAGRGLWGVGIPLDQLVAYWLEAGGGNAS
jgi:hypothetical protein